MICVERPHGRCGARRSGAGSLRGRPDGCKRGFRSRPERVQSPGSMPRVSKEAPARARPTAESSVSPRQPPRRAMPPTEREAQRTELHKTIWRIANDLRGQRRRVGLQVLRPRDALLPLHLGEPHGLHQRTGAQSRAQRLRLQQAHRHRGRVRAQRDCRGEGLLHPSVASCSPMSASGPRRTRISTRRWRGSSRTSKVRPSAPTAKTTSRACSTTSTSIAQARPDSRQAEREARQAARRHR